MKHQIALLMAAFLCLVLVGCGGSGSESGNGRASTEHPSVTMVSPENGATQVSKSPSIQLQFSEQLQNFNASYVTLHATSATGDLVPIGDITPGANNTYTFSPLAQLNSETTYYVVVGSGLLGKSGNTVMPTTFSLTTGDFVTPTVSSVSPSNGATQVSASPSIQLQFSEAVQNVSATTVSVHAGSPTGATVAINPIMAGGNNTYTFSPAASLLPQTTYYVVVSNGITDGYGVSAIASASFSFTTGNFVVPTVNMVKPSNGATQVSATPAIGLAFSEAVQNVSNITATLHANSPTGPTVALGGLVAAVKSNKYILNPIAPLNPLTTYFVVVSSGITDKNGTKLTPTIFSFTTGFNTPLWANEVGVSGGFSNPHGVAVDVNGNSYVVGSASGKASVGRPGNVQAGINDYFIAQYSASGTVNWIKQVGQSGYSTYANAVTVDNKSGNIYVVGHTNAALSNDSQAGNFDYFIAQYSTAGTLNWIRQGGVSSGYTQANGVSVDRNGNIYVTGYTQGAVGLNGQIQTGVQDYFIAQYSVSGAQNWVQQVDLNGANTVAYGVVVDNSDNVYVVGNTDTALPGNTMVGINDYFVAQYSTTGTVRWTTQGGFPNAIFQPGGVSVDSQGNVYVAGSQSFGYAIQTSFLAKYSATAISASLAWTQYGPNNGTVQANAISIDGNDNIYVGGYTTIPIVSGQTQSGNEDFFILQYNTSGTTLAATQLGSSGGTTQLSGIATSTNGSVYVAVLTNQGIDGLPTVGNDDYFIAQY